MIDKTEDQIAKDKEAVRAMTGAKAAMEASLRRIEMLEAVLKSVREQAKHLSTAHGPGISLRTYNPREGNYRNETAETLFSQLDETIKKVL